jgi:hypothetical protein
MGWNVFVAKVRLFVIRAATIAGLVVTRPVSLLLPLTLKKKKLLLPLTLKNK